MSTSFEPNDELCRLWQKLERPQSGKQEVLHVMELVESRARNFDRSILWRNVREYVAAAIGTVIFAFFAANAGNRLEQVGYALVSASGLWTILFLWLMQRSRQAPVPESSGEIYTKALLAKYDRQILLTRTAWAWYVLPPITGLVIAALGYEHAPVLGYIMAAFFVISGVVLAGVNWHAANKIAIEKRDLVQLLNSH
jgi:hypothetical protein